MHCLEPIRTNISKQIPENCYYHQQLGDCKTFLNFKKVSNFFPISFACNMFN